MEIYRYQTVEKHIMSMIESGALGLNDKLPSLRSLSSKIGVSISTVNQAYLELERKRIIESRPRSGFFVRRESTRLPRTEKKSTPMDSPRPVTRIGLIQTVLESVGGEGMVSLAVVAPGRDLLPLKELGRITAAMVRDEPGRAMGYAPIPGDPRLIHQIAYRSMEHGISVAPDDPIVTAGCLEALYISLRSTCRRGDTVLIQSPTYYCFLQLLETLGLRAIEVPSCPQNGVLPEALHHALKTFDISACVFAPNFNNPDSSLTSDERKKEIVSILAARNIPLIEDDVSTDLHYGPKRPGTFKQFDEKDWCFSAPLFPKPLHRAIAWAGCYRDVSVKKHWKSKRQPTSLAPLCLRWPSPNTCGKDAWNDI